MDANEGTLTGVMMAVVVGLCGLGSGGLGCWRESADASSEA